MHKHGVASTSAASSSVITFLAVSLVCDASWQVATNIRYRAMDPSNKISRYLLEHFQPLPLAAHVLNCCLKRSINSIVWLLNRDKRSVPLPRQLQDQYVGWVDFSNVGTNKIWVDPDEEYAENAVSRRVYLWWSSDEINSSSLNTQFVTTPTSRNIFKDFFSPLR